MFLRQRNGSTSFEFKVDDHVQTYLHIYLINLNYNWVSNSSSVQKFPMVLFTSFHPPNSGSFRNQKWKMSATAPAATVVVDPQVHYTFASPFPSPAKGLLEKKWAAHVVQSRLRGTYRKSQSHVSCDPNGTSTACLEAWSWASKIGAIIFQKHTSQKLSKFTSCNSFYLF